MELTIHKFYPNNKHELIEKIHDAVPNLSIEEIKKSGIRSQIYNNAVVIIGLPSIIRKCKAYFTNKKYNTNIKTEKIKDRFYWPIEKKLLSASKKLETFLMQ